jgi:hypothetical protein
MEACEIERPDDADLTASDRRAAGSGEGSGDSILNSDAEIGKASPRNKTHVKVFEKDGYPYVDSYVYHEDDGGRLDEYLPGLFFTPSGKCLDLRGPVLGWQNWRIQKVDNDPDRKFDLN